MIRITPDQVLNAWKKVRERSHPMENQDFCTAIADELNDELRKMIQKYTGGAMSAERQVFKQISEFIGLRDQFGRFFNSHGASLIDTAIREFFLEHPQVLTLKWKQRTAEVVVYMDQYLDEFQIDLGDGRGLQPFGAIEDIISEQLHKCLMALESSIARIGHLLFSEEFKDGYVCISREDYRSGP